MQSNRLYHLSRDGQPLGKYDEGVMRELIRVGKLRPTDDYWTPGMKAWAKLAILPAKSITAARPRPAPAPSSPASPQRPGAKIRWTKLWPVPALLVLALLIGYSASTTQEPPQAAPPQAAPPSERKPTTRKEPRPAETTEAPFELTKGFASFRPMGREIFPSHIISFANIRLNPRQPRPDDAPHYGHPDCMAGVVIDEPRRNDRIVIEVSADRFMRPSSVSFTVKNDAGAATAGPAPLFDFETLAKVRQTTPFNVTIKVRKNEADPVVFTEVWQAHQINDCPNRFTALRLTSGKILTYSSHHGGRVISGYVNENHPMIDQVLAEAKATGIVTAFTGYGDGKDDIVSQIDAVWTALNKRGVTYSNVADSTRSPLHTFQHVRLLDQCLKSGQANCVDATAMLASVLKKIGLNVGIILVPKHAYLIVYDKTGKKREFAIESTAIQNSTLREAIKEATERGEHSLRKIEDRLDDETDDEFHEVAIEDCRKAGIQPIPYGP
jgi:hypothetical protein